MMRVAFICLLTASVFSSPAGAEVYKWVDAEGTTHYSDRAPDKASADVVQERISVYTSSDASKRAPSNANRVLENRVEQLENQLLAERRARDDYTYNADAAWQAAYQQCLDQRRVDCDSPQAYAQPYYPTYAPYVVVGPRRPLSTMVTPRTRPAQSPAAGGSRFNPSVFGGRGGTLFGSAGPRR